MILEDYIFTGCYSNDIQGLIQQKKQSGYIYDSAKYILIQFDQFCIKNDINEPAITKEISDAWKSYHADESKSRRASRMGVLRQLAQYMMDQGKECYIPSKFSAQGYRMPYVMNDNEIREFFAVADHYVPQIKGLRFQILAEEYKVLLLCSKGDKDRLIYIADDVCEICLQMIQILHEKYNFYSEYLFPSSNPDKPLEVASVNKKFKEFWKNTSGASDSRYPTVHSLRYSFVVKRMNLWMEEGKNLTAMMPYLSKYLGHESVENTYYYYYQIESAFKIVRQKDLLSDRIIPEVAYEE